jgi:hypothetical protein
MKATITQERSSSEKRYRANYGNRTVVYVNDPLATMLDKEIFDAHGVRDLNFECKSWNQICRAASKLTAKALAALFESNYKITYSRKAGCTCGCSPGFIVKRHSDYKQPFLKFTDMWVDVEYTEQELNDFKTAWYDRFKASFMIEKLAK